MTERIVRFDTRGLSQATPELGNSWNDKVSIAVGNELRIANAKFDERLAYLAMTDEERVLYDIRVSIARTVSAFSDLGTAFVEAMTALLGLFSAQLRVEPQDVVVDFETDHKAGNS